MATAKMKLARRMMTQDEIKLGVSPFLSKAWNERKEARRAKEADKRKN